MIIFRYEFRQLRQSVILWALSLGGLIFLMTPVYIDMLRGAGMASVVDIANQGYFEAMGTSLEILSTPLGAYSFLTSFVLFACAVNGMNMGLSTITKEYRNAAADFLMTKPHSRSKIYVSKLLAGALASLVIGLAYLAGSWAGMEAGAKGEYVFLPMVLIAFSTIFVHWIFLVSGMLLGVISPRIRTPISISAGTAFLSYVTASFSFKMGYTILGLISPFTYFKGADIITHHGLSTFHMIVFLAAMAVLITAGHQIFCKKDVMLVS